MCESLSLLNPAFVFMLKHGQRMFGQIPLETLFSFLKK